MLLALACALVLAGCSLRAGSRADRLFAQGDFVRAAQEYEAAREQGRRGRPEDLFRLAVIYLSPDGGVHDPGRGEELLREVVTADVGGAYRAAASLILLARREVEEAASETDVLRGQVGQLEQDLRTREERVRRLEGSGAVLDSTIEQLQQQISQARRRLEKVLADLDASRAREAALEDELEKLKAIDLGRPPQRRD